MAQQIVRRAAPRNLFERLTGEPELRQDDFLAGALRQRVFAAFDRHECVGEKTHAMFGSPSSARVTHSA